MVSTKNSPSGVRYVSSRVENEANDPNAKRSLPSNIVAAAPGPRRRRATRCGESLGIPSESRNHALFFDFQYARTNLSYRMRYVTGTVPRQPRENLIKGGMGRDAASTTPPRTRSSTRHLELDNSLLRSIYHGVPHAFMPHDLAVGTGSASNCSSWDKAWHTS